MRRPYLLLLSLMFMFSACDDKLVLEPDQSLYTSSFYSTSSVTIPDQVAVYSPISVTGMVGTVDQRLSRVKLNINHTYDGDLEISLYAPNGSMINLSSDNGGGGDNYTNTEFSSSGASITGGSAPFSGMYTPEQSFSGLSSSAINGIWYLIIYDNSATDTGVLLDWTLTFLQ